MLPWCVKRYSPSNVLLPGLSKVGPEGVDLLFVRVQGTECVNEITVQQLAKAFPFFSGEACSLLVLFGVLQV